MGGGPITKVTVNAGGSVIFDADVLQMYSSYSLVDNKWTKSETSTFSSKKYVYVCCTSASQYYNMLADHIAVGIPIDVLIKKLPKHCLFQLATVMHANNILMKSTKQIIADEILSKGSSLPSTYVPVFKTKTAKTKDCTPCDTDPSPVAVPESIQEGQFPPEPPSRKLKDTIIRDYCAATAAPLVNEAGCAVCGELTVRSLATPLKEVKDELEFLKDVGYFPSCGKKTEQNVLEAGCNIVCDSCLKYTSRSKMPPNAMANGLWLGDIPADLQDLTWAEQLLISKVRMNRFVVRVGSGRKKLNAHVIAFESPVAKVYKALPPPIKELDEIFAVILVGPVRPSEDLYNHMPILVRRNKVGRALRWLKTNNYQYKDLEISDQNLSEYPDKGIPVSIQSIKADSSKIAEATSVNDIEEEDGVTEGECPYVVNGLIGNDLEVKSYQRLKAIALAHLHSGGKVLAIGHGEEPQSMFNNPDLYPMMFPWLFPYGHGGIGNSHISVRISSEKQKKHYLLYHDKRFQLDRLFPLVAFSHEQVKSATSAGFIVSKQSMFEQICSRIK